MGFIYMHGLTISLLGVRCINFKDEPKQNLKRGKDTVQTNEDTTIARCLFHHMNPSIHLPLPPLQIT